MQPPVRNSSHGATIIPLPRPIVGQAAGIPAKPPRLLDQFRERLRTLHRAACRYASVLGGLAFLKGEPGFHTEVEQWDADPYTLNCADGLLDLRTQTLRPHDPEALCTKVTLWSYSETASTGAWQHHLERCLVHFPILG